MKILIVYATAGAGHRKAAEAIYAEARARNLDVMLVDILDHTNKIFKYLYAVGYIFLIKHFPVIWMELFRLTDNHKGIFSKIVVYLNRLNCAPYKKFLEKEKFDIVISTHFMSTDLAARAKPHLNFRLINVVTDFYPHGFWVSPFVDKYLVASDNVREKLITYGLAPEAIKVTGIPVHLNFSKTYERGELSKKLGLRNDLFSVLLMTGAIGVGPIAQIIKFIKDDAQVLVVCGSNKELFNELSSLGYANLKVFGLVDNVHELMSVCDIIITKPGGMTVSESLAKNLPMVFFSIIPGQEAANAKLMQDEGAGIILNNVSEIRNIVLEFKNTPYKLGTYRDNAKRLSRPHAASSIVDTSLIN